MNWLPKTEYAYWHKLGADYKTIVVWRQWLWFNYGHKEFKVTGFYQEP